jgi:hypothetical protein
MRKLYDLPLSLNCCRVRLLMALLGVDYERDTRDAGFPSIESVWEGPACWLACARPVSMANGCDTEVGSRSRCRLRCGQRRNEYVGTQNFGRLGDAICTNIASMRSSTMD